MAEIGPVLGSRAGEKYAIGAYRDGAELEHIETKDTITLEKVERTPSQNLRRHWARFWCCYTFWSVIFLAIFLPIFFLICIPAISQRVVDNSNLVLVEASVLEPRPDSALLTIKSALKLPIGLPVRIDPITLALFNRDTKGNGTYVNLYIPGKIINGNTTLGVTNQPTPLDADQWQKYVNSVVNEPHAPLSVHGTTMSYLGELKSKVTMDKDIATNTLNGFAGFSISDSRLLLPAESDGTNLVANATLPNPSVLTLEIGHTVLDLYSGDLIIGNATLDNLMLKPGNHTTPVRGIIDLQKLIKNLPEVLQSQDDSLRNGYLNLKTIGKSVTWQGVEVPYYTNVMKNLVLEAQVPVGSLLLNTIHGVLHKNGTNPFANLNLTEPVTDDDGSLGDSLTDSIKNSGLADKLSSRSFGGVMDDPQKRAVVLEYLSEFL